MDAARNCDVKLLCNAVLVPAYIGEDSLKDESFIFHNTGQVAYELCMNACRKAGFTPRIVCRTSSPTTTFYMVQGGLGIAILPSEEFRSRTIEGVTEVRITDEIKKP